MKEADRARCPRCGAESFADTPEGLCAACLRAAIESTTHFASDVTTTLSPTGASSGALETAPALAPGQLFGSYRIERLLGQGGMGDVYEAEHVEQGRRIALKVLNQSLVGLPDRARFLREGQLAASVNHPNSVYIFGSEEVAGMPVIVMELLSAGTRSTGVLMPRRSGSRARSTPLLLG